MYFNFRLQSIEFEWDECKAFGNQDKHGVTFEEAAEVFFDSFQQSGDTSAGDEQRNFMIGYSMSRRILLVVYTERHARTRIISARLVMRAERKQYEEA